MKYERLYYTEHQQELAREQQKEQERLARRTPEEAAAENAKLTADLQKIWASANRKKAVFNAGRDKQFRIAVKAAKRLAEFLSLDLLIDIPDNGPACIILRGCLIAILGNSPASIKKIYLDIQTAADEILITGDSETAQLELSYERFDYI